MSKCFFCSSGGSPSVTITTDGAEAAYLLATWNSVQGMTMISVMSPPLYSLQPCPPLQHLYTPHRRIIYGVTRVGKLQVERTWESKEDIAKARHPFKLRFDFASTTVCPSVSRSPVTRCSYLSENKTLLHILFLHLECYLTVTISGEN